MAKYKRAETLEEDELTYSQELGQENQGQEEAETPSIESKEGDSWEKRYGDLRRHFQRQQSEHDKKLEELQKQLDAATKQQLKFPKSDEEIEAWSKKYPEVAKIVDTIARKRASEVLEQGEQRIKELEKKSKEMTAKEAMAELLKLHPDFPQLRAKKEFHDWIALQPKWISEALYKNNTDHYSAARAIDLYKADMGKKKTKDPKGAASAVSTRGGATPAPEGGKRQWRESQVEKMSDAEYDKYEDQILEDMRTGNFIYDISGAAR